jgi:release factor glutamine methyltransferase
MDVAQTHTPPQEWTILSMIEWSAEYLRSKQFDEARLHVELLLCHVLRCARIDLYVRFDQILTDRERAEFKQLFQRRLRHEPLQYILGETEFMGVRLLTDSRVLIPRPETELLVEKTMEALSDKHRIYSILDVGCGSGNIAICLARMCVHCTVDAMDISEDALKVVAENVSRYRLFDRIVIFTGDILCGRGTFNNKPYDIIVSNPPYISKTEFEQLQPEISTFEPRIATTDDADGLTFYRAIATNGIQLLKTGGHVFVEIAYNQGEDVPGIFQRAGYTEIQVYNDYNGMNRVVRAKKE